MSAILGYLREYFVSVDKALLLFCGIWVSILIALNYQLGIEHRLIARLDSRFYQFWALFGIYSSAFIVPYLFIIVFRRHLIVPEPALAGLLLIAPVLFALKVSVVNPLGYGVAEGGWGSYWVSVTTLPFKFLVVLAGLAVLRRILPVQPGFWGVTLRNFCWKPYFSMLAMMIPLIVFASMQPDFLSTYPRLKQVAYIASHTDYWFAAALLYEISYGIDFVTIELFFRGFLIIAFVRYVGAAAILPMAVFYCSIHFGKPLLECISSFFGGLILGVVAYRTQSIVGGLAVHLGIAWMMEIGGYVGNSMVR